MSFGKYSYGSPNVHYPDNNNLFVGNFTSIAQNVTIYLGNGYGHDASFVTTYPFSRIHTDIFTNVTNKSVNTKGDVIIGSDVWICENVKILSGVTIGDGAVVANSSHVVKNVEPYSIVGGNPAQFIKYRFSPQQIEKLLEIKWWNWDDEKINSFMHLICNNNIDEFIEAAINRKKAEEEDAAARKNI